mgnify:CR=1 FL=1
MTTAITTKEFTTKINVRTHELVADEPKEIGGQNEGPTPSELLHASLASCSSITLRMYINRKEWDVQEIKVSVKQEINLVTQEKQLQKIIKITGNLDDQQMKRLLTIAGKCPVHKLLSKSIIIESSIV